MKTRRDYYEILGVQRRASAEEIRRAFRSRARQVHPDVNPDKNADEQFKELNQAYQVLSDPVRRSLYDWTGSAYSSQRRPGRPGGRPARRSPARSQPRPRVIPSIKIPVRAIVWWSGVAVIPLTLAFSLFAMPLIVAVLANSLHISLPETGSEIVVGALLLIYLAVTAAFIAARRKRGQDRDRSAK